MLNDFIQDNKQVVRYWILAAMRDKKAFEQFFGSLLTVKADRIIGHPLGGEIIVGI